MTEETFEKAAELKREMSNCHLHIENLELVKKRLNDVSSVEKNGISLRYAIEELATMYPERFKQVVENVLQMFARQYQVADEQFKLIKDE